MATWVLGLPLLFWHRWPRLTQAYAWYAIAFVVLSQASQWLLGDCFLTTWTDRLWDAASPTQTSRASEWLTVRLANAVFHLSPSHRAIVIASETLAVVSAGGMLVSLRQLRSPPRTSGIRAGDAGFASRARLAPQASADGKLKVKEAPLPGAVSSFTSPRALSTKA